MVLHANQLLFLFNGSGSIAVLTCALHSGHLAILVYQLLRIVIVSIELVQIDKVLLPSSSVIRIILLCTCIIVRLIVVRIVLCLHRLYLAIVGLFNASSVQIVALHPIEATEDEEPLVVQNDRLMESSRGERHIKRNAPGPGLKLEIVLVDVVESLEGQVDPAEDVHGRLGGASGVPVATLDVPMHLPGLQPDARVQIENRQVVQGHLTVPSPENVHVMLVNHSRMSESNLRLGKKRELVRDLLLRQELQMLLILHVNLSALNIVPTVSAYVIAVHVAENVSLVSPPINVKLVEVAHEAVISPRLRCVLRVKIHPLLLERLELGEIVEVDAAFSGVPAEEKDAVLEGEAVGARPWRRLVICHLRV